MTRTIAGIVLATAFIRLPALVADFWFDEILSYERFARHATSVADIFLSPALKHDNNHHLNTLVLYLMGEHVHWILYRVPGAIVGLVASVGAIIIGFGHGRLAAVATGVFVGGSFVMAVYGTEARGYPWLLLAAAFGFLSLKWFLSTRRPLAALAFWASTAVGMAAHPTILHFYVAALCWSGYRLRGHPRGLAWLHLVPLVWIALWGWFVVRGAIVGGGPAWTWNTVLDQGLAWTFGYPLSTIPAAVGTGIVAVIVVLDARILWTEGSDEGLFYVTVIFAPFMLVAALSPPYLFPRYFLVPIFFLLIVCGRHIARLAAHGTAATITAAISMLLFAAGNAVHLRALVAERRGNPSAALHLMTRQASDAPVVVSSRSLDQWTQLPIQFYEARGRLPADVVYISRSDVSRNVDLARRVMWVVEPAQPCGAEPRPFVELVSGDKLTLVETYPVCGPSGMSWTVYGRQPERRQNGNPTGGAPSDSR